MVRSGRAIRAGEAHYPRYNPARLNSPTEYHTMVGVRRNRSLSTPKILMPGIDGRCRTLNWTKGEKLSRGETDSASSSVGSPCHIPCPIANPCPMPTPTRGLIRQKPGQSRLCSAASSDKRHPKRVIGGVLPRQLAVGFQFREPAVGFARRFLSIPL